MMKQPSQITLKSASQRGIGLVELLIGILLGMLTVAVVLNIYSASEGRRRTTASGSDAQSNGAVALYRLERDLRRAGYGLNVSEFLGCKVRAHTTTRAGAAPNASFDLVPVKIAQGASGAPDTVTLAFGNADGFSPSSDFQSVVANGYRVNNRAGYFPGDLLVLVGPGTDANVAVQPGTVCRMSEVNGLPTAAGDTNLIVTTATNYTNVYGQTVTPTHNPASGVGVAFTGNGSLLNLGRQPRIVAVSITNTSGLPQLTATDQLTGQLTGIADEIVDLQAQYGVDDGVNNGTVAHASYTAGDGILDGFVDSLPATPTATEWTRIVAVRIAVLARSVQREKIEAGKSICSATATAPTWGGGAAFTMSGTDWQCYRYAVFETIVPLRNLIWKQ
jgi:type IV pilus assembly protein PilW